MRRTSRPRVRRLTVLTTIAGTTTLILAACGGGQASPNATGEPSGKISYWYSLSDNSAKSKEAFVKYNVTAFNALHPDVTVDAVNKSSATIDQNIQVALAAGRGPDIIQTPGTSNATPYAEAGYLTDLTDQFTREGWGDKLLPWAAQAGKVKGKIVMIPQYYETLVLYYNKTLFQQNGWTVPKNRSELESVAADVEAKGIMPFAAGNADFQPSTGWLVTTFLNAVAGPEKVHDALTGKTPWTDPAFKDSIDLLKGYFDKGWFGGGAKQYFTTTDAKKYAQLADGKAAMYISGSWETENLPDYFGAGGNTNEWDWAPLPSLADGVPQAYPLSIGGTLSVNSKSANTNAATTYLSWIMTDTKTMWEQAAATGRAPLPVKFKDSDIPSSVDPRYARIYTSLQSAQEVGYTTWTSFGGKADAYITANIDKVLNGKQSVDEYLAGLDSAFQADYSRGLVPVPFEPKG
jgi:raffinose/stachyose/melibiose transport system substrate-binding protein